MSKLWIYTTAVLVVALVLGQETAGNFRFPLFGNGGGNGNGGGFGNQVEPDTGFITRTRRLESCGPLPQLPSRYKRICSECFIGIAQICVLCDTRFGTCTPTVAPSTIGPTATTPTVSGPTSSTSGTQG